MGDKGLHGNKISSQIYSFNRKFLLGSQIVKPVKSKKFIHRTAFLNHCSRRLGSRLRKIICSRRLGLRLRKII
jgi:hypothetical protein